MINNNETELRKAKVVALSLIAAVTLAVLALAVAVLVEAIRTHQQIYFVYTGLSGAASAYLIYLLLTNIRRFRLMSEEEK